MSASPLVFTYNYPGTSLLDNFLVDASGSPLPGDSKIVLNSCQSPNLNVQGITLTIQAYNNSVRPLQGATTSVKVVNITIIASSATNTIGTMSFPFQFQNPIPGNDPYIIRARVPKVSCYVNSASGIFANYLFGNVIQQFDNTTGNRTISIYSAE